MNLCFPRISITSFLLESEFYENFVSLEITYRCVLSKHRWNVYSHHVILLSLFKCSFRAYDLLDQLRKKSQFFRHNNVLLPIGDDFRFTSDFEWDQQMKNLTRLIWYMNSHMDMKVEVCVNHSLCFWGSTFQAIDYVERLLARLCKSFQMLKNSHKGEKTINQKNLMFNFFLECKS